MKIVHPFTAVACLLLAGCASSPALEPRERAVEHLPAKTIDEAAAKPETIPGARLDVLRAGPDYVYVLVWRTKTGSAEQHRDYDDIFVVREGTATLLHGGVYEGGKKPDDLPDGELRGGTIRGGTPLRLGPGDIVTIPAGMPHQVLLEGGDARFVYAVVKPRR